jgi:hypothetical protein
LCAVIGAGAGFAKAGEREKESSRFLKKAAQKFLFTLGRGRRNQHGPKLTKFFCYFLFTKSSLLFSCLFVACAELRDCAAGFRPVPYERTYPKSAKLAFS